MILESTEIGFAGIGVAEGQLIVFLGSVIFGEQTKKKMLKSFSKSEAVKLRSVEALSFFLFFFFFFNINSSSLPVV